MADLNVPKVEQRDEEVDAQVVADPQPAPDKVRDFSTAVQLDEPVLDPSAENAVLVKGQGGEGVAQEELLPLHKFRDAEHVEDVFAREASQQDDE
jgi:hypothetical protein